MRVVVSNLGGGEKSGMVRMLVAALSGKECRMSCVLPLAKVLC